MLVDSLMRATELSWAGPSPLLSPPCEVAAHFLFGVPLTCSDFPFPTYPQDRDPAPRSNWHQAQDSHFPAAKRQTHKPLRVCPAGSPVLLLGAALQPSLAWTPPLLLLGACTAVAQSCPRQARVHPKPAPYLPLPKVSLLGPLPDKTLLVLSQSTSFPSTFPVTEPVSWALLHGNSEPESIFWRPGWLAGCCQR